MNLWIDSSHGRFHIKHGCGKAVEVRVLVGPDAGVRGVALKL